MTHARHPDTRPGFTIVELLIVIVVIGILATLILVGYNTANAQAKAGVLKSDLVQASQQLGIDKERSNGGSAYPLSLAAANGGNGLVASATTTYGYSVNNTVTPAYFCLSATNAGQSFYLNSSTVTTPTAGTCLDQGLAGWWPLNGNANDASGNGHNGTVTGAVPTTGQNNAANSAYYFNGSSSQSIDTGYGFPLSQFTVSAWVNQDGTGPNSFSSIVSNTRDCCSTNSGFQLMYQRASPYKLTGLLWAGGAGSVASVNYNAGLPLSAWSQVVLTYDGTTFTMYKDGASVGSGTYTGSIAAPSYNVGIGRMGYTGSGYTTGGKIDDVRIYSRSLGATDVQNLYAAGAQ